MFLYINIVQYGGKNDPQTGENKKISAEENIL
jgi:hypothetical protein